MTGIAAARPTAGTMLALAVVEMQQAEAVPGRAEATAVPVVVIAVPEKDAPTADPVAMAATRALVAPYLAGAATVPVVAAALETVGATVAGAAARLGRTAVPQAAGPAAARERAARIPDVVVAAMGPAGAAAGRKKAAPVALEPLPAVPGVRAMVEICRAVALAVPVLAEAVAILGMTKAGLAVETPAAVLVQMEQYPVEEVAVIRFALLEEWVYLVEKAVVGRFGQMEVSLLLLKPQEEALAPRLNCLEQRDLAWR